jgi:hypothetical protein
MTQDNRSEWQKRMGVGERQPPAPQQLRRTVEITSSGAVKEKIEYIDGRVDNHYTLRTQEVGSCQPDFR